MFGLTTELDIAVRGLVLTPVALLWVVLLARIIGLRTFSKMTAFDFVSTVAMGSLLATAATASSWENFTQAILVMAILLVLQWILSRTRIGSRGFRQLIENTPLLLMRDGRFCDAALRRSRITREDVLAKIRDANALRLDAVRAVVLETTGDISVLHGDTVDAAILGGVRFTASDENQR